MTPNDFIAMVLPHAVLAQRRYSLPAAAMIAQAALETGWGNTIRAHNLFNIKGLGPAGSVNVDGAWEVVDGRSVYEDSVFRAYHGFEESFEDYAQLITKTQRYAAAVASSNNALAYAKALQDCGYATDPQYAEKLISIIHEHSLLKVVIDHLNRTDAAGHWAQADIDRLRELGIMSGYPDGSFRPDRAATRAELATIICRLIEHFNAH